MTIHTPQIRYKPLAAMTEADLVVALKDPYWRLRNLYKIKDKAGRTVTFVPNAQQQLFLDNLWYRNIVPKARQRGFSTLTQILMLDTCLFVPDTDSAVIAQDAATAKKIRDLKIKFAYDRLPDMVRHMVPLATDNIEELAWGNGSRMAVTSSARGGTLDFLHVSEYGIICVQDSAKAREIQEGSLPAVPKTGIVVIESTVESPYGIFSDMVRAAEAVQETGRPLSTKDYRLHFASWWDADEYELDPNGIPISPVDHAYFNRLEAEIEQKISRPKRAWYVITRDGDFGGDEQKMWRQYPSTLKEAFTVARGGLWLADQMAKARTGKRITTVPLDPSVPVNTFWDLGLNDSTAIWLHQQVGPRDHFIHYFEGSGEAPSFYVKALQEIREERGFVWGTHYLPHDGATRKPDTRRLVTWEHMLQELGLKDIEIVERANDVDVAIQLLREDMSNYWIDETYCKEGIVHLDGFAKVYNRTMQLFTGSIAQNGHQHAADAIRQKAQAKAQGLLGSTRAAPRSRRPRASAMQA